MKNLFLTCLFFFSSFYSLHAKATLGDLSSSAFAQMTAKIKTADLPGPRGEELIAQLLPLVSGQNGILLLFDFDETLVPFDTKQLVDAGREDVKIPQIRHLKPEIKKSFEMIQYAKKHGAKIDVAFVSRNPVEGVLNAYKDFLFPEISDQVPIADFVDPTKTKIPNFKFVDHFFKGKKFDLVFFFDDKQKYLDEFTRLPMGNWTHKVSVLSHKDDANWVAQSIIVILKELAN